MGILTSKGAEPGLFHVTDCLSGPSDKEPWGWQLDGHHAVINHFVLGDQVVMSPVFMGSEPIEAKEGKFKGTIVLQEEQSRGLKLIKALNFDRTHFAWIGGATAESVYYYRVHSPVILIEFDHQRRVAPFRTTEPTRDHIYTVVRTPQRQRLRQRCLASAL